MNYVYDSLSWYKIFMPATIIYADSILFKWFSPIEPAAGRPGLASANGDKPPLLSSGILFMQEQKPEELLHLDEDTIVCV